VTALFFALPHRFRWLLLLLASCYFYMAFLPIYILILGGTIVVDYFAGIRIEQSSGPRRKWWLVASLVANIGVLAVFKYYNFLNGNLSAILNSLGYVNQIPNLGILLPIGLSFHTFQAMSYTIEVYRGSQKAERHFGIYSLYVMFYPQLVAGPIERPQNMLHQFYEIQRFDYDRFIEGLKLMLWGFFMKLVVADRMATYVDAVYNNVDQHTGPSCALATVLFAFQIYCDFAGYSNIAIGSAKVMGFNLMTNFRRPYFSKSVAEFWTRWHISLSTWFKDYLYISLGGNRVGIPRWYLNLMIVFLISGLWHGANWTYIIWGGLNGLYLIGEIMVSKLTRAKSGELPGSGRRLPVVLLGQMILTFLLICLSWIFFRANSVSDGFQILQKILTPTTTLFLDKKTLFYSSIGLFILLACEFGCERTGHSCYPFHNRHWLVQQFFYASLIVLILLIGVYDGSQFIYFQF
jgi:D-alanyl-lipoteichoic acid acyltransferase DltB (MBOAT superfamily)